MGRALGGQPMETEREREKDRERKIDREREIVIGIIQCEIKYIIKASP
jgi:hypothetical protein